MSETAPKNSEMEQFAKVTLGWTEIGAGGRSARQWERDARRLAEYVLALLREDDEGSA